MRQASSKRFKPPLLLLHQPEPPDWLVTTTQTETQRKAKSLTANGNNSTPSGVSNNADQITVHPDPKSNPPLINSPTLEKHSSKALKPSTLNKHHPPNKAHTTSYEQLQISPHLDDINPIKLHPTPLPKTRPKHPHHLVHAFKKT